MTGRLDFFFIRKIQRACSRSFHHSSEKYASRIVFTDKALPTMKRRFRFQKKKSIDPQSRNYYSYLPAGLKQPDCAGKRGCWGQPDLSRRRYWAFDLDAEGNRGGSDCWSHSSSGLPCQK